MVYCSQQRSLWAFDRSLLLPFVRSDPSPTVHRSILHHQSPSGGNQAYDTLSLESSDSMETSVSTGNSACTPERWPPGASALSAWASLLIFSIPKSGCWGMTRSPSPCVLQWLRDGGPKTRRDGEDAEGGTAGKSQAHWEQSEWRDIILSRGLCLYM